MVAPRQVALLLADRGEQGGRCVAALGDVGEERDEAAFGQRALIDHEGTMPSARRSSQHAVALGLLHQLHVAAGDETEHRGAVVRAGAKVRAVIGELGGELVIADDHPAIERPTGDAEGNGRNQIGEVMLATGRLDGSPAESGCADEQGDTERSSAALADAGECLTAIGLADGEVERAGGELLGQRRLRRGQSLATMLARCRRSSSVRV